MAYYCESDSNFLSHYGVRGMHWGQRKANRYRQRELKRIDRKYKVNKLDRKISKLENKNKKEFSDKRANKIKNFKIESAYQKGMRSLEKSKVMKMTVSEMMRENKDVKKERSNYAAKNQLAYNMVKQYGGIQVTEAFNANKFKTDYRISKNEEGNIYRNAEKKYR